jgi:hypothetical protein
MKRTILALALAATFSTSALAEPYLGLGIGTTSDAMYKTLAVGYNISPRLSFEAAYQDFGKATIDSFSIVVPSNCANYLMCPDTYSGNSTYRTNGFSGSVLIKTLVENNNFCYLRLGMISSKTKSTNFTTPSTPIYTTNTVNSSQVTPYFGVGVDLGNISKHVHQTFDFTYYPNLVPTLDKPRNLLVFSTSMKF